MLNKAEKDYLIDLLEKGESIPEDYKYKLFPAKNKEYELSYAGKMRKEDLLANHDGSFPSPLQIEKVFNKTEYNMGDDEWRNMIVFGDNLQFLKTIYKNEDPIIKDKVKKKVKLIYIDPPFATSDNFQSRNGGQAYTDKKKGAEFIEYLRKRLILAKEVLADDGSIYLHIDSKMGHYIKVLMDEIFPSFEFSEIIWLCGLMGSGDFFPKAHETIYCYRAKNACFNPQNRLGLSKRITGALTKDENGWYYTRGRESSGGMNCLKTYICSNPEFTKDEAVKYANSSRKQPVWSVWIGKKDIAEAYNDFPVGTYAYTSLDSTGYPTQKPELLLKRIIMSSTAEGDIVMDFFGGSGTTAAVAEKLGRRWITCDIGKLSFYTVQKRMLQISKSRDLFKQTKKYEKSACPFVTLSLGSHNMETVSDIDFNKYKEFISNLFNIKLKETKINGYSFDGEKDGNPVVIFNFNHYKEFDVDEAFILNIHKQINDRLNGGKVYIVTPSTRVDYITDYKKIDGIRYYFLKIPHQVITEFYQKDFTKLSYSCNKSSKNIIDESIGFSFNRTPSVNSDILFADKSISIIINSFVSEELGSLKTVKNKKLSGFDLLSAVFIDCNYNGKEFMVTDVFFSDKLKRTQDSVIVELNKTLVGERIMVVYTDIFGNHFTECFNI